MKSHSRMRTTPGIITGMIINRRETHYARSLLIRWMSTSTTTERATMIKRRQASSTTMFLIPRAKVLSLVESLTELPNPMNSPGEPGAPLEESAP
jgi:hypothetical protein